MPMFSVILEDVTKQIRYGAHVLYTNNQRVELIEAEDIHDAWVQARRQYYTLKVDGPDTQIVDIEAGTMTLEERAEAMKTKPIPVGTAVAPPAPRGYGPTL